MGRTPCGVRGLKYLVGTATCQAVVVAPLVGCVD